MATAIPTRATIDDLYKVEGKAELIGGRIVKYMANGLRPGIVSGNIYVSLRQFWKAQHQGVAVGDGVGFTVPELPSGRESFCPDAAFFAGQLPANRMRFIDGPPTLAIEVRSENDYSPSAEQDIAEKRADYFEAGTLVVWDVDPIAETVAVYRSIDPTNPVVFRRGQIADAEPAVPGWTMSVDEVFAD